MPCFVTGSAEGDERLYREEVEAKATRLCRLLCELCRHCEGRMDMPPRVRAWWVEHKKVDAKREAEERRDRETRRLARKAKAKLTVEEREALGL
jgi:hypothetical protein